MVKFLIKLYNVILKKNVYRNNYSLCIIKENKIKCFYILVMKDWYGICMFYFLGC